MGKVRATRGVRDGQTLPLFVVTFVAVLAFAGLALDGARLFAEHSRMQGAADAAAIGAAHELLRGNLDYSSDLLPAAVHDAALAGVQPAEAEIIVHHPPVSGDHVGSANHVEVAVRHEMPTTFMGIVGRTSQTVTARAVAGLVPVEAPCLSATAPSGARTLVVEGSQPLTIDCPVALVSADAGAWDSGPACVSAGRDDGACVQSRENLPQIEPGDLLSSAQMPSCTGRPLGVADTADDGITRYWPGCYDSAVLITAGSVELMPGQHVFRRGLRIVGGEVWARDVTLLFPATQGQTGVQISASARVDLGAPSKGRLANVLMFAAAGEHALERGQGSQLDGGLYFPGQDLRWAPNAPGAEARVRVAADRIAILEGSGGRAIPAWGQEGAALEPALVE